MSHKFISVASTTISSLYRDAKDGEFWEINFQFDSSKNDVPENLLCPKILREESQSCAHL